MPEQVYETHVVGIVILISGQDDFSVDISMASVMVSCRFWCISLNDTQNTL